MNGTEEFTRRLDVAAFVDDVRGRLEDLSDDEREELVDGLEADLTERLEESRDPADISTLGSAADYADELRAAAGLAVAPVGRVGRRARWAGRWSRLESLGRRLATDPRSAAGWRFLATLQPVWWVARAWVAVHTVDLVVGDIGYTWVPSIGGPGLGLVIMVAAVVVSVQIGRGEWWPATARTPWSRWALVGANWLAVIMLFPVLSWLPVGQQDYQSVSYGRPYRSGQGSQSGLKLGGEHVRNIYAFDAAGRPVIGVQLFDGEGNPLAIKPRTEAGANGFDVAHAWPGSTDESGLTNVYPLAHQVQSDRRRVDDAFNAAEPPTVSLPFLSVPPVVELPAASLSQLLGAIEAQAPEEQTVPPAGDTEPGRGAPGTETSGRDTQRGAGRGDSPRDQGPRPGDRGGANTTPRSPRRDGPTG